MFQSNLPDLSAGRGPLLPPSNFPSLRSWSECLCCSRQRTWGDRSLISYEACKSINK